MVSRSAYSVLRALFPLSMELECCAPVTARMLNIVKRIDIHHHYSFAERVGGGTLEVHGCVCVRYPSVECPFPSRAQN